MLFPLSASSAWATSAEPLAAQGESSPAPPTGRNTSCNCASCSNRRASSIRPEAKAAPAALSFGNVGDDASRGRGSAGGAAGCAGADPGASCRNRASTDWASSASSGGGGGLANASFCADDLSGSVLAPSVLAEPALAISFLATSFLVSVGLGRVGLGRVGLGRVGLGRSGLAGLGLRRLAASVLALGCLGLCHVSFFGAGPGRRGSGGLGAGRLRPWWFSPGRSRAHADRCMTFGDRGHRRRGRHRHTCGGWLGLSGNRRLGRRYASLRLRG